MSPREGALQARQVDGNAVAAGCQHRDAKASQAHGVICPFRLARLVTAPTSLGAARALLLLPIVLQVLQHQTGGVVSLLAENTLTAEPTRQMLSWNCSKSGGPSAGSQLQAARCMSPRIKQA